MGIFIGRCLLRIMTASLFTPHMCNMFMASRTRCRCALCHRVPLHVPAGGASIWLVATP